MEWLHNSYCAYLFQVSRYFKFLETIDAIVQHGFKFQKTASYLPELVRFQILPCLRLQTQIHSLIHYEHLGTGPQLVVFRYPSGN